MTLERFAELEVARLELKRGDILLVRSRKELSVAERKHAAEALSHATRDLGVQVLFAGEGFEFTVVEATQ